MTFWSGQQGYDQTIQTESLDLEFAIHKSFKWHSLTNNISIFPETTTWHKMLKLFSGKIINSKYLAAPCKEVPSESAMAKISLHITTLWLRPLLFIGTIGYCRILWCTAHILINLYGIECCSASSMFVYAPKPLFPMSQLIWLYLPYLDRQAWVNSVDMSDAAECKIWSGSTLFATHPAICRHFNKYSGLSLSQTQVDHNFQFEITVVWGNRSWNVKNV